MISIVSMGRSKLGASTTVIRTMGWSLPMIVVVVAVG